MLTGWANDVALIVSGFAIGVMAVVAYLVTPREFSDAAQDWRKGEGLFSGMKRRAEAQANVVREGPRAFRRAGYAQIAVIAVVVLAIWLGPISVGWLLVGGVALGAAVAYGMFRLAGRDGAYDPAR